MITASVGVALWHGGYRAGGQLLLAAAAIACVAVVRPRPRPAALRDPLLAGLAAAAAANLASLAWNGTGTAPALAAVAVAVIACWGSAAGPRLGQHVVIATAGVGLACATAGLAGLVLHSRPLAERIDGIWRAGGTFEYPPALGLLAVCAIAAVLALRAEGTLDRAPAVVACAVLTAGVVATFDRAAAIGLVVVAVLFAVRIPSVRPVVGWTAAVAAVAAVVAIGVAGPSTRALERHLRHGPLSSRQDAWRAAWNGARDRPVLGYGPGTTLPVKPVVATAAPPAEAHDAVLQEALDAGVVAAVGTAVALIAMLLRGGAATASRDPVRLACGVAAVGIALSGLYDFTWSFAPLVLLGALAALGSREQGA
ncbi:MAG TPA: O-antigen ligase family protein [Gaiellales bacterium]|nr:O-antigen ligase family protein [Gaiellales bacterium]